MLLLPAAMALAPPALSGAPVAPALAQRIAADPLASTDAFVSLAQPITAAQLAAIEKTGVSVHRVYESFGVVYVVGEGRDILEISRVAGALLVSGNEKLQLHLNTATVATNARDVWDTRSTSTTPVKVGGVVVDGTGVGVAVIDSGVDATHPDLAPAMGRNLKWACSTPLVRLGGNCAGNALVHGVTDAPGSVRIPSATCGGYNWEEVPDGDTSSGHGTHVAGAVAGRGIASGGRHTGAAPGATLYGFGSGEVDSILVAFALDAFAWVDCNHDKVTPAIRVVTNSWGGDGDFDANDPVSRATDALVAKGIVVLFAAGNAGGNGSANTISPTAKNPTPGVISVANYDDSDLGTRAGAIDASSSRGAATEPAGELWPDVAAPGMGIMAPRAKTGAYVNAVSTPLSGDGRFICCGLSRNNEYLGDYTQISGTSMATPHVAGIVALLLQANPSLTPAQVEEILEDTATPIASAGAYLADPTNPGSTTNLAAGHGLVDALAAVKDPRVGTTTGTGSPQPAIVATTGVFVGAPLNPQAAAHAKWVVPAGPVGFAKLAFSSIDTAVGDGTQIRFKVDDETPLDTTIVAGRADVDTTIAAGNHVVEVHVLTGGVWRAFDSFRVDAV